MTILHLAYCYELSFILSWIIIIILILFIASLITLLLHRRNWIILLNHSYYCYILLRVWRKCLVSLMRRWFWSYRWIDILSWIQVDIIEMNCTSWLFRFLLWFRIVRWLEKATTFPPLNLRPSTRAALILLKARTWTNALCLDHHLPIEYLFIGFIIS